MWVKCNPTGSCSIEDAWTDDNYASEVFKSASTSDTEKNVVEVVHWKS